MAAPPIAVPRYFTVVEVARALGVAQQRLRALVAAGNGPPATRLSKGRLLFCDDALAAWLAERGVRLVA
jgi:DNA-binding transcriptional MerR regulator